MNQKTDVQTDFRAEDWVEIYQLIADYNSYLNSGNAEGYGALYTVDGTFVSEGRKPVVGRDNLVEFIKQRWTKAEVRRRRHFGSNIVVRPTANGAEAESHHLVVEISDGSYHIEGMHIKLDELRRVNGKWRFHSRKTIPIAAK